MPLTLADARTLADEVVAGALARGLSVACCVLDDAGRELVSLRMDTAGGITSGIARSKARTAAVMGRNTDEVADLAARVPDVVALVSEQVAYRLTTLRGGVVVRVDDALIERARPSMPKSESPPCHHGSRYLMSSPGCPTARA